MKIRQISLFAILTILVMNASGQTFTDCNFPDRNYTRVQQPPHFTGSLQDYFDSSLNKSLAKFNGTLQLTILIDLAGRPCCSGIHDNTSAVSSSDIKLIVDQMPYWKPALHHGKNVFYSVIINLSHHKSKLSVQYVNERGSEQ